MFSWFSKKNNTSQTKSSRKAHLKSLIVQRQTIELVPFLRKKPDRDLCIEGFFELFSSITDDKYMFDLFQLILQKSSFKSSELSPILTQQLSKSILSKNFDLCQRILHLPFQSLKLPLPTYETIQLIHQCTNIEQLLECLSILIEKNLPYDSEYLLWILIIIFENYLMGDEIIIEYIINKQKKFNLLFKSYGDNHVTPLMLFLHLYTNKTCQLFIDQYISKINDQSILLQCDRWNRSYLMHLLCGKCEHDINENLVEDNKELINQCSHSTTILPMFTMLYNSNNKCDTLIKTIFTSGYCLPLQMILLNYVYENNVLVESDLKEFFLYFPSKSLPNYIDYIKPLVRNQNLDSTLIHILNHQNPNAYHNRYTIEFLLQQGARIHDMTIVENAIINLLGHYSSLIPFVLLDYAMYINISYDTWRSLILHDSRLNLYICRLVQCGCSNRFQGNFNHLKASFPQQTTVLIEKFIDLKNPSPLKKLCLQKLRNSLKNLGNETIDTFKDYLPNRLRQSIVHYGYEECGAYFHSVMFQ